MLIDISTASPKQLQLFKARSRYVAYGGARGGGKSWALRKKLTMLAVNYSGIRILLLRRTLPDLRENHINTLKKELLELATFSELEKAFTFPNGSRLRMGYCDSESDVDQYQGQEFDIIALDEATQFTEYQFNTLKACLRGANDFPKRIYLTCNPGGIGHEWVKRLFISRIYRDGEKAEDYSFIPATVFDNKILLESDPGYIDMLNSLDPKLRDAWRDGKWDLLAGRYFNEFDRTVHVIPPFEIPSHWKRYRAIDYGLDCLACLWIAIDERGDYYVYREYAKPDMTISAGAGEITAATGDEKILYTVAPDDLWARSQESAKSKAIIFSESGLPLLKASRTRDAGWLAVKELLAVKDGTARLKIFSTCPTLADNLPALQRDHRKPDDCMTEPHDITHLPDALRYFCLQYTTPSDIPDKRSEQQKLIDRYKRKVLSPSGIRRSY